MLINPNGVETSRELLSEEEVKECELFEARYAEGERFFDEGELYAIGEMSDSARQEFLELNARLNEENRKKAQKKKRR